MMRAFSLHVFYLLASIVSTAYTFPKSSFMNGSVLQTLSRRFFFRNAELSPVQLIYFAEYIHFQTDSFFPWKIKLFLLFLFHALSDQMSVPMFLSIIHVLFCETFLLFFCLCSWSYSAKMSEINRNPRKQDPQNKVSCINAQLNLYSKQIIHLLSY